MGQYQERMALKEGDPAVIHYLRDQLEVVEVTKVTKTQISAGGKRFMRGSGREVGSLKSNFPCLEAIYNG